MHWLLSAAWVLGVTLLGAAPAAGEPPPGMILIPAGPFIMGADEGGEEDEHPAHEVVLRNYYIDRREVTRGEYDACVEARKCPPPRVFAARFHQPERPVVGVTHDAARAYCAFVSKRLPTEAEWEKAARGPKGQTYPWGEAEPVKGVHGCFGWVEGQPCLPGAFPQGDSPYGVTDMAGNVWEWTADVYDAGYYPRSPADNPPGSTCAESITFHAQLIKDRKQGYTGKNPIPTECEYVLRGGAWNYPANGLRSSNRVHHAARFRINVAGIRCAADAPPQPNPQPPATP